MLGCVAVPSTLPAFFVNEEELISLDFEMLLTLCLSRASRRSQFMVGRSATERSCLDKPWDTSFPSLRAKIRAPADSGGMFAVVLQGRAWTGTEEVELLPKSITPDEYEVPKDAALGGACPEPMAPTAPG